MSFRLPTLFYLGLSIILFALGSPITKWLVVHGGMTGIIQANAISFCNVLFVGNFCAAWVALAIYGPKRILHEARTSVAAAPLWLAADVLLAVLIPILVFTALQTTTITNLVLLGRVEAPAYAILSLLIFKTSVSRRQWLGYVIIVVGVMAVVLIQGEFRISRGDLLVVVASLLYSLGSITSKRFLEWGTVAAFVFVRNATSAIVFFVIAVSLYGFQHFAQAFGPGLWLVMSLYAFVVVVLAQLAWYRSLSRLPPTTLSNWSVFTPLLSIAFAFAILGEIPEWPQVLAGGIILVGIVVTRSGKGQPRDPSREMMEKSLAAA